MWLTNTTINGEMHGFVVASVSSFIGDKGTATNVLALLREETVKSVARARIWFVRPVLQSSTAVKECQDRDWEDGHKDSCPQEQTSSLL